MRVEKAQQARQVTLAEFWREEALSQADEAMRQAAKSSRMAGREISCRKGCGACCRQLATISPAEAWALLDEIDAMPEEEGMALSARFSAAEARLRAAGLLEKLLALDDPEMDDEAHYELARVYFRLGLACPFLVDESCSVHAARPARCREYLVTSPAGLCADPFTCAPDQAQDQAVVARVELAAEVSEAMIGLCAHALGTEARVIPISLIPEWARRRAEERGRSWPLDKLRGLFELHLMIRQGGASDGENGGPP